MVWRTIQFSINIGPVYSITEKREWVGPGRWGWGVERQMGEDVPFL